MPRPTWKPTTDEQRELLAKLDKVAARIGKDVGELWEIIEAARAAEVPTELLAKRGGVGRATIYRRLGKDAR
jgi:transcriptional regulator of acetoin/glycerol metabolism